LTERCLFELKMCPQPVCSLLLNCLCFWDFTQGGKRAWPYTQPPFTVARSAFVKTEMMMMMLTARMGGAVAITVTAATVVVVQGPTANFHASLAATLTPSPIASNTNGSARSAAAESECRNRSSGKGSGSGG
jgi:hypothetical protein